MSWSTTVTYIKVENAKLHVEVKSHLHSDQPCQPISPPSKEQGVQPSEAQPAFRMWLWKIQKFIKKKNL